MSKLLAALSTLRQDSSLAAANEAAEQERKAKIAEMLAAAKAVRAAAGIPEPVKAEPAKRGRPAKATAGAAETRVATLSEKVVIRNVIAAVHFHPGGLYGETHVEPVRLANLKDAREYAKAKIHADYQVSVVNLSWEAEEPLFDAIGNVIRRQTFKRSESIVGTQLKSEEAYKRDEETRNAVDAAKGWEPGMPRPERGARTVTKNPHKVSVAGWQTKASQTRVSFSKGLAQESRGARKGARWKAPNR